MAKIYKYKLAELKYKSEISEVRTKRQNKKKKLYKNYIVGLPKAINHHNNPVWSMDNYLMLCVANL
jgi:hypothetical protein